jgi:hypothetical protein
MQQCTHHSHCTISNQRLPRLKEALAVRPQGVRPWSRKLPLHNSTHKKAITNNCSPILSPAWVSSISFHCARKLSYRSLINFRILKKPSESYRDEKKKNDAMSADMRSWISLGPEGTCFLFQKISILQVCSLPKHFPETLSNPYVHTFQLMSQQNHPRNQWVPLPLYSGI